MKNASPTIRSAPRRETLTLRIKADDRRLVDCAAVLTGKSSTDFVLEAARSAAEDALLDRTLFIVAPKAFEELRTGLDEPSHLDERLNRSMQAIPPWK